MGRAVLQASGNDHHNQHHNIDDVDNVDDHGSDDYFDHDNFGFANFNIDDKSKHDNLDLDDYFPDDDVITPRSADSSATKTEVAQRLGHQMTAAVAVASKARQLLESDRQ